MTLVYLRLEERGSQSRHPCTQLTHVKDDTRGSAGTLESVLRLAGMPKGSSSENGEGAACNMHARHAPTEMPTGGKHRKVPGVMIAAHGACSPVSHTCTGRECGMRWQGIELREGAGLGRRHHRSSTEKGHWHLKLRQAPASAPCSVLCPQVCAAASCDG